MKLRPYQQHTIAAIERGWSEFRRQLAVLPTGGGKTVIFSHLAARQPGRTIILAHREELISQAAEKLHRATGIQADREKASDWANLNAQVVVGSIQTLCREQRRQRWPKNHFDLVVVDEAHHIMADSYRSVLSHFEGHARVLGVTATPRRSDKRDLGAYFENIAAEVSLFDLIDQGYLSKIVVQPVPLQIDLRGVDIAMDADSGCGDFRKDQLADALEPYLDRIAETIARLAANRRTLAFLPLIATSHKFVDACRRAGLRAQHVDGESLDRKEILARFAGWEFDVLSNAMLLTEGFDDPGIDCVVCLRPTRSEGLFQQVVGRGTRIDSMKENLLLLDFLWMHDRFSPCRPAHLIAKTDEEAEAITKLAEEKAAVLPADVAQQMPLDLQGLASETAVKREESLRKQLEQQRKKKGKTLSAQEWALAHNSLDAAEFEPVMKWEGEPVTEKQAKYLKRAGIDLETVRGKGHASKLLSIHFAERGLQLASPGQVRLMKRMGVPNAENATADEARKFFATLKQKEAA